MSPPGFNPRTATPNDSPYKRKKERPKNIWATLKRLFTYFVFNKWLTMALVILLPLGPLSGWVSAWFIRPLINDYIIPGDLIGLRNMLIFVAIVYAAGILATYLQNRLLITISQKAALRLRTDLFGKMQSLPIRYFDSHKHGELMSRYTNDLEHVQSAMESSLVHLISAVLSFSGAVVMMLILSPPLFIITALAIFATVKSTSFLGSKSRKLFQQQQKNIGEMNGYIEEIVEGLTEVKSFNNEAQAKKDFNRLSTDYRESARLAAFWSGIIFPIANNISLISYAVTAAVGGLLTIAGHMDVAMLGSYLQFTKQTGHPIQGITSQINTILAALAGAERIFGVVDEKPETDDGAIELDRTSTGWQWINPQDNAFTPKRLAGDIRINNVSFSYNEDRSVLKNISVYAKPGQKIALVGSTGAGKTTISNLLTRFYDIDEGKITFDGLDIKKIKKDSLRRSISMVLQDINLFSDTIMENIRYGRLEASDEECIAAAKSVNAHGFISQMLDGYQTVLAPDGSNISQGQRQLIAIARAACADTPVMILDEATSSIDTRTETLIEAGLDTLMKNRTIFVIAHRLSTVRNADAIIVIEDGQIIERGNHKELLEQEGYYYKLYNGQYQLT